MLLHVQILPNTVILPNTIVTRWVKMDEPTIDYHLRGKLFVANWLTINNYIDCYCIAPNSSLLTTVVQRSFGMSWTILDHDPTSAAKRAASCFRSLCHVQAHGGRKRSKVWINLEQYGAVGAVLLQLLFLLRFFLIQLLSKHEDLRISPAFAAVHLIMRSMKRRLNMVKSVKYGSIIFNIFQYHFPPVRTVFACVPKQSGSPTQSPPSPALVL